MSSNKFPAKIAMVSGSILDYPSRKNNSPGILMLQVMSFMLGAIGALVAYLAFDMPGYGELPNEVRGWLSRHGLDMAFQWVQMNRTLAYWLAGGLLTVGILFTVYAALAAFMVAVLFFALLMVGLGPLTPIAWILATMWAFAKGTLAAKIFFSTMSVICLWFYIR